MLHATKHRRDLAAGDLRPVFEELEAVRDGGTTELFHGHHNFNLILEAHGPQVLARRRHARHADAHTLPFHDHREAERAQERVLHRFHVVEELREVDDPGHVGVAELNDALHAKHYRFSVPTLAA